MAKNKRKRDEEELSDEQQFHWFMTTAYVLSATGLLHPEKEKKLASLDEYGVGNWKVLCREELGVDDKFIRSVYALCTEYNDRLQAIAFILRGFGCPCAEEQIAQFEELT